MAIVNFSVPDEVKKAFDKTFAGANKSAIVAQLMRQAVEERQRQRRRALAVERLLLLRRSMKPIGATEFRDARMRGRP